jgi:cytochrome c-type biogenesis protein CcmH/NrfG
MTPLLTFLALATLLALLTLRLLLSPLLRSSSPERSPIPPARRSAAAILLFLPMVAGALYLLLGSPAALQAPQAVTESAETPAVPPQVLAMAQRLRERLAQQPNDAEGWQLYIRTYKTLGQASEALRGYQQLQRLLPPDATRLTQHAVTLAMAQGSGLAGEPEALIQRALHLEPLHPQALALAGSAAQEHGDRAAAKRHWEKLLALTPADSEAAAALRRSLSQLSQAAR